jgi:hypothetical protein
MLAQFQFFRFLLFTFLSIPFKNNNQGLVYIMISSFLVSKILLFFPFWWRVGGMVIKINTFFYIHACMKYQYSCIVFACINMNLLYPYYKIHSTLHCHDDVMLHVDFNRTLKNQNKRKKFVVVYVMDYS